MQKKSNVILFKRAKKEGVKCVKKHSIFDEHLKCLKKHSALLDEIMIGYNRKKKELAK